MENYKFTDADYIFKRKEITNFVVTDTLLNGKEKNMSPNELDQYRDVGIIPKALYITRQRGRGKGFFYVRDAAEWASLGRVIFRRSRARLEDIGKIFQQVIESKGAKPSTLEFMREQYFEDENISRFVERLKEQKIHIPIEL